MNGRFLVRPDPGEPPPAERVAHAAWLVMSPKERREFLRAVGIRVAVRDFGMSVIDVALALPGPVEEALEKVRLLAGDVPPPGGKFVIRDPRKPCPGDPPPSAPPAP